LLAPDPQRGFRQRGGAVGFHHPGGFAVFSARTANLSTVVAESQLGLAESGIQLDAVDFPS
jgi:hypothetical protein